MENRDIEDDIRNFLADQFFFGRAEELSRDESLLGTVIDSTGTLVLVTYLQDNFGIAVEDEEVVPDNLDSIENMAAFIARKLHVKAQAAQA